MSSINNLVTCIDQNSLIKSDRIELEELEELKELKELKPENIGSSENCDVRKQVSEEMINKHYSAIDELKSILELLIELLSDSVEFLIKNEISDKENKIYHHFKRSGNFGSFYMFINKMLKIWGEYLELKDVRNKPEIQVKKGSIGMRWNSNLNRFRGFLNKDSLFMNDLLLINGHHGLKQFHESPQRERKDISTREIRQEKGVVLKASTGRLFADTPKDMGDRIISYLADIWQPSALKKYCLTHEERREGINWRIDCFNHKKIEIGVEIQFPITNPETLLPTGKFSTVTTNEPKVLSMFFGGTFPGYRIINQLLKGKITNEQAIKYRDFLIFAEKVKQKIHQLIGSCRNESDGWMYNFVLIKCPRTTPNSCDCEVVIPRTIDKTKPYECVKCNMEICPHGCGRQHHGNFECSLSTDEMSNQLIKKLTKICPGCQEQVGKIPRTCNHITCKCRVEFCFICGKEYEKDRYGKSMVVEHHREVDENGKLICNQFIEIE